MRVGGGLGRVKRAGSVLRCYVVKICLEPLHLLKHMQIAGKLLYAKVISAKWAFRGIYSITSCPLSTTFLVSELHLICYTNAHTCSVNNSTNKSFYNLIGCRAVRHEEASQQGAGGGGDLVLLRVCEQTRRAQPCSSLLLRL